MTHPEAFTTSKTVNPPAVAPNFIVNTDTGEIISPNEIIEGVAVDRGGSVAPSLDDTLRVLDRYFVRAMVKKNSNLVIVTGGVQ